MRSFLFRPGIFYTLCPGPSFLEPHLAGLFASFSAQLKHHLLREDLAHHHSPGPLPAPLTSLTTAYLITCIFFIGSFLIWKLYFLWYGLPLNKWYNIMAMKPGTCFFPSRSLRSVTNKRATIFYFSKCWIRGCREEASKPSCRTKTKRKRHE